MKTPARKADDAPEGGRDRGGPDRAIHVFVRWHRCCRFPHAPQRIEEKAATAAAMNNSMWTRYAASRA
jgi:hypothetical protein